MMKLTELLDLNAYPAHWVLEILVVFVIVALQQSTSLLQATYRYIIYPLILIVVRDSRHNLDLAANLIRSDKPALNIQVVITMLCFVAGSFFLIFLFEEGMTA